jgi:endonuclease YncB( thermonuclease family)
MLKTNTIDGLIEFLNVSDLNINNVKSYIPDINYGKVIKVYDGDTVTIATTLHNGDICSTFELYKFSVRILGVDTPELKTKNAVEHELGIIARDALSELLLNKVVKLENVSYDKYGRILCNLFLDDINISEWLISKNLAVRYDGGTKIKKWDELN